MIDAAGGFGAVALRFAALTATTAALGAWAFGRLVLPRLAASATPARTAELHGLANRIAVWATGILAIAAPTRLLLAPGDASRIASIAAVNSMGVRSLWGGVLVAQGIVAAVACAALLVGRARGGWPRFADACLSVLALLPPFLGHAWAAQELRGVSVLVDLVHLLSAAGWVGALGVLTVAVLGERDAMDGPTRSAELIVAFHPVAVVAAPAVFVTGLVAAWLRMGAPVGIASPTYSGLFVAKLLLVGVAGAVGAGHSKLASRRVRTVNVGLVRRSLLTECLVAVLVLVVTAVLTGTAPIG